MTRRRSEAGSATLELAVAAPALLLVVALVVAAGRLQVAGGGVEHAAVAAARTASLARTPAAAQTQASAAARDALARQGMRCDPFTVRVTTAGFAVPVGTPATVSVTVGCRLPLGELGVPGLRTRVVTATATSPLDTYRAR